RVTAPTSRSAAIGAPLRRHPRVSAITTSSTSGCPASIVASRASATHVTRAPGWCRLSAVATGSACTTSPIDDSLTIATFIAAMPALDRRSARTAGPEPLHDRRDDVAGGMALRIAGDRGGDAERLRGRALGHRCLGVIGALGMDVRLDRTDESVRRLVVEDHDVIDRPQRSENLHALRRRHQRPALPFEASN